MVIKPNLDVDEVDKVVAKVQETIESFDGKVLNTDKIGRKKLAYDIQKFRDGFFATQVLTIPADKVEEFKRPKKFDFKKIDDYLTELKKPAYNTQYSQ